MNGGPGGAGHVRGHLADGGWIEGYARTAGMPGARVILLDPLAVRDARGVTRAGTPLDSFIPERDIMRVEPITATDPAGSGLVTSPA